MPAILECIPNFSEGQDKEVIRKIAKPICSLNGVKLLNIDMGFATNRTIITFAGTPEAVSEAAFQSIEKASELIDMRFHKGVHPRIGAADVIPMVPISGITMEEAVEIAHRLAERVGEKLSIPVYCYENAAFEEKRRSLENCRKGEYEGLQQKLNDKGWKPDFGPAVFNEKSGATIIGARNFLVAFNVNLDTESTEIASEIASEIRESGKIKINDNGSRVYVPGKLKYVKAIGWYIGEYKKAQVSMNLTNINMTPVHVAFEEVKQKALNYGVKVTGSELIGLISLKALTDAGNFYNNKLNLKKNMNEKQLIDLSVEQLGLNELRPFIINERIIECAMENKNLDKKF